MTIDRDKLAAVIRDGLDDAFVHQITDAVTAHLSAVPVEGEVTHDENTLTKVYGALDGFLDSDRIVEAVNEMQNAGILFRERAIGETP